MLRGARVFLHIALGVMLASVLKILLLGVRREAIATWWNRHLLSIMHVQVTLLGQAPSDPRDGETPDSALYVCNHVSWLDIPVLASRMHANFVSKAEVRNWPVIGWLAHSAGTEFHKRGGGGSRALIDRLVARIEQGQNMIVFPEGTTTMGVAVRRFQPRLFAAAIESGRPVVPIALKFGPNGDAATTCPYVGDDMFVPHLVRLLRLPKITATVTILPALNPADFPDRGSLAKAAEQAINEVILADPPQVDLDRPAFALSRPAEG